METGHLRRWWVIPPRWGGGTEGLRWHRATFVRNPLAWKAPKPLWTPQEQMWLQKEKNLKGMSVSAVLTHLPGLRQGSFLAVLSCTDPHMQTSKIN